jgi:hypothetical protein
VDYPPNRRQFAKPIAGFSWSGPSCRGCCQTSSGWFRAAKPTATRPRRCRLRRSRAGRGAWPAGCRSLLLDVRSSASQVSPFRVSGRWCPPFPRCWQPPLPRVPAKDRNVRVGLQSLSRRHTPSCLPPETGPTRPVLRTRQIATLPGPCIATGTPRHLSSGGSGWLAPVDGNSGPGLRFKALVNRSAPASRCQRLASRASRSSSSQCQDPSRIRRRIRTGPCTAQTAVRRAGSSCSRTCVVLAILESSPHPGVGGLSRSRPYERWSSACWRACRLV